MADNLSYVEVEIYRAVREIRQQDPAALELVLVSAYACLQAIEDKTGRKQHIEDKLRILG